MNRKAALLTKARAATLLLLPLALLTPEGSALVTPGKASDIYRIAGEADYGVSFHRVRDRFGNDFRIAAHRWSEGYDRVVVLVHGYAANCAYMKPLQRWFLARRFDVICLELPGHGQSSGAPADIPDMLSYADIYRDVIPQLALQSFKQRVFVAHSTGSVGIIEQMLDGDALPLDHIIMVTPLVRSAMWDVSNIAYTLVGGLIDTVPRRKQRVDDPEYHRLLANDPRPIDWLPLHWFGELAEWNETMREDPRRSSRPVTLVFADQDTVIDTDYNRRFLESRFDNAETFIVEGAGHIVYYAEKAPRQQFFAIIATVLSADADRSADTSSPNIPQ